MDKACSQNGRRRNAFKTLTLRSFVLFVPNYLTNSMAYGTQMFNATFTKSLQLSLSWAESTQLPALILISLRSIIILITHLRLGLPKGLFPVGLPVKILKALLTFLHSGYMPAHLNLLDLSFYRSPTINRVVISRRLAWEEHVDRMAEELGWSENVHS